MRILTAALLFVPAASAQFESMPRVGDTHEITQSYETTSEGSDGSSGSSSGRTTIVARVIEVRSDGMELKYDLPPSASAEDRARDWQFPARILKPVNGPAQLRNRPEIEARIAAWLKAAGLPRTDCGRWIFTWNVFRIECDPESVLATISEYDLRSIELREGAPYHEPATLAPGILTQAKNGSDGATFAVELQIDPDAIRLHRAEADVVAGEITRMPVTLEAARRKRVEEQVSGTMSLTFETDATGEVRRRTAVTALEIKGGNGQMERETRTVITERRVVAADRGS